jgi:hypothetical protein
MEYSLYLRPPHWKSYPEGMLSLYHSLGSILQEDIEWCKVLNQHRSTSLDHKVKELWNLVGSM